MQEIEAIDMERKQQDDLPSRPEMIRRMIDDWIGAKSDPADGSPE